MWRPKDLEGLDPKLDVARIGHTVGENKRVKIIDEAKKVNIRILNPGVKKTSELEPEPITEPETTTDEGKEELPATSTAEPERAEPSEEKETKTSKKKTTKKKTTKRKSNK